jgi:hypothetical protein
MKGFGERAPDLVDLAKRRLRELLLQREQVNGLKRKIDIDPADPDYYLRGHEALDLLIVRASRALRSAYQRKYRRSHATVRANK